MKNYKNMLSINFKILMLLAALNINFVTFTSSSARKMIAPAVQSGLRAMTTEAVTAVPTILASSLQNFQPMVLIPQQSTLNQTDGIFTNTPKALALPQSLAQAESSGSSGFGSNSVNAAILAGLAAGIAGNQVAHADDEDMIDIHELYDEASIDAKLYPELANFLKKYRCSDEFQIRVQRSIWYQNHYSKKNLWGEGHHGFQPSSGLLYKGYASEFFIKGSEIDRIINAERMKKIIELNKFDCLGVADKCLAFDGNSLCVVSKKIKLGDQAKKISLKEVKQLFKFAFETGYWDLQLGRNIIRDIDGKLVFVDTEDVSYNCRISPGNYNALFDRKVNLIHYLLRYTYFMDNDAKKWLRVEYSKLQNSVEGQEYLILLPTNSQYDAEIGIDFNRVREEFFRFEASKNKGAVR